MNKVLLAAIAKDEAAYLPEWIFYHLSLGVAKILVYVNNTSDNTIEILDKISNDYPVEYTLIDGIETNSEEALLKYLEPEFAKKNPLQSRAYAKIYSEYANSDYSHILYLDIDEFLFSTSIPFDKILVSITDYNISYFNWFNLTGDMENFSYLSACKLGQYDTFTKFIVKPNLANVRFHNTHKLNGEVDNSQTSKNNEVIILHRHLRSLDEYLSLLGRQDTWNNTVNGFKKNRHGWSAIAANSVDVEASLPPDYSDLFHQFIDQVGIENDIQKAQEYVMNRKLDVLNNVSEVRELNHQLDAVLDGTNIRHHHYGIKQKLRKIIKNIFIKNDVNQHR